MSHNLPALFLAPPTVEGLVQLDPVLVHKVAVVLAVPEARVPEELADAGVQTAHRVGT